MKHVSELDVYKIPYTTYSLKKGHKYADIALSFDIETTSAYTDGKYIYSKNETGNLNKIAFPYIFQFGVGNEQYYTRSIYDVKKVWDYISDFLDKENLRCICLVHNFPFEFAFTHNFIDYKNIFCIKKYKPVKAEYRNIEFRDSYILDNVSLEKLAEKVQLKKMVGDLDYNVFREPTTKLTIQEIGYCKEDVHILTEYFYKEIFANYIEGKKKPWIPLTKTSKVRHYIKSSISDFGTYHEKLKKLYPKEYIFRDFLRPAYRGGYVHANVLYVNCKLNNVTSIDLDSDYPSQLIRKKFPMTPFRRAYPEKLSDIDSNNYAYLIKVRIENMVSRYHIPIISFSKVDKIENKDCIVDNGMILKCKKLELTVTETELEMITKYYKGRMKIIEAYKSKKSYLPKEIIKSVEHFYIEKKRLKKEKNRLKDIYHNTGLKSDYENYFKAEKELLYIKEMLNSIYGMMVTNPLRDVIKFINNNWVVNEGVYRKYIGRNDFLVYQWGVWVTAYARYEIMSTILLLEKSDIIKDFVYSDTDSIKLLNYNKYEKVIKERNNIIRKEVEYTVQKMELSKELIGIGEWDNEGTYDNFIPLGAKRYCADNEPTVSGVKKKAISDVCESKNIDMVDYFKNGFKMTVDESGKITMYIEYHEKTNKYILPSGNEIEIGSFIHAEPTTFEVDIKSDYEDLYKRLQKVFRWELERDLQNISYN